MSGLTKLAAAGVASLLLGVPSMAEPVEVEAPFIQGTYASGEGCKKLDAIANGGPKNVGTVPETLTRKGFETWEGGCSFTSIKETVTGKTWVAGMACMESADESTETDTFELLADGRIQVTVEGKTTIFERCKTKEAK